MKRHTALLLLPLAALLLLTLPTAAQQMNYQGRLTDAGGNPLANGQQSLEFTLWSAATGGTTPLWGPFTQTADIVNGRFNVVLGPNDARPAGSGGPRTLVSAFGATPRYLQIKVGTNAAITPRQALLAAPEALHALKADTVQDGSITTASLADGSVTAAKLAGGTGIWLSSGSDIYRLNGNVGIGLTSPVAKLDIVGDAINVLRVQKTTGSSDPSGQQHNMQLELRSGTGTAGNRSMAIGVLDSGRGVIQMKEVGVGDENAAAGGYQKLLLNPVAGNVGIGTTDPEFRLQVLDPGLQTGRIHVGGTGANGAAKLISFGDGNFVSVGEEGADDRLVLRAGNIALNASSGVGIGTLTPTRAKLEVIGIGTANYGTSGQIAGVFNSLGRTSIADTWQNLPVEASIYTSGAIIGSALFAVSDARIKIIQGRSDPLKDLETLENIVITDYLYKDVLEKGSGEHKKVIAQQLEKVFPQAVRLSTNVVPDIYTKAPIQDGWITLVTDLKPGERIRLIANKEDGIHEILEAGDGAFRTAFKPDTDTVFVYGREVDDFRSVDYEAISMLNVSATQQIKKEMDAREKALQDENAALRSRVAALEAKDEARDTQLATIEALLTRDAAKTVSVSLSR